MSIKAIFRKFVNDQRGEAKMVITVIIGLYIAMILTASLAPGALTSISLTSINTTNWSIDLKNTFGSVSILYGVALVLIPAAVILRMLE